MTPVVWLLRLLSAFVIIVCFWSAAIFGLYQLYFWFHEPAITVECGGMGPDADIAQSRSGLGTSYQIEIRPGSLAFVDLCLTVVEPGVRLYGIDGPVWDDDVEGAGSFTPELRATMRRSSDEPFVDLEARSIDRWGSPGRTVYRLWFEFPACDVTPGTSMSFSELTIRYEYRDRARSMELDLLGDSYMVTASAMCRASG